MCRRSFSILQTVKMPSYLVTIFATSIVIFNSSEELVIIIIESRNVIYIIFLNLPMSTFTTTKWIHPGLSNFSENAYILPNNMVFTHHVCLI